MTRFPEATHAEAADRFDALATACADAGLTVEIVERPSKITVTASEAHPHMAEAITLRPNARGLLTWYWSWDAPIGPAENVAELVRLITRVTGDTDV
jgi:hypothetical protein